MQTTLRTSAVLVCAAAVAWQLAAPPSQPLPWADNLPWSLQPELELAWGTRVLIGSCHKLSCNHDGDTSALLPSWGATPESVSVAGGCVSPVFANASWPAILTRARGANGWVWAGDAVYTDVRISILEAARRGQLFKELNWQLNPFIGATPKRISAHLNLLKSLPQYQELRKSVPVFGVFDDHDFGLNDGGSTYPFAAEAGQLFLDFLDEPASSPRRRQRGIYASHIVGQLHLVLLDVRSNRDPYGTPDGDFLGEEQWIWLEELLHGPSPPGVVATIIVSSLPVLADRYGFGEGWHKFPTARERLLRLLASSRCQGLAIVSGDIHLAEMNLARCGGVVNPENIPDTGVEQHLLEMTTSGMTHAWRKAHAWGVPIGPYQLLQLAQAVLPFNTQTLPIFDDLNFGEVAVSADGKWLRLGVFDASNTMVLAHIIPIRPFNVTLQNYTEPLCIPWRGPNSMVQTVIGLVVVTLAVCLPVVLCATSCSLVGKLLLSAK